MKPLSILLAALLLLNGSLLAQQAPRLFDFEPLGTNVSPGSTGFYPGWAAGGTQAWKTGAGQTPSYGTGPNGGCTPGGYWHSTRYLFCEADNGSSGHTFMAELPLTDVTGITSPALTFEYHMDGSGIGTLMVQEEQGGTWVTLWQLSGDQGYAWTNLSVPLTPVGNQVRVRIVYIRGFSSTGDAAIDNCWIGELGGTPPPVAYPCSTSVPTGAVETFDSAPPFPTGWTSQMMMGSALAWTANSGPTPSACTGPSDDLTAGGSYMYTEASSSYWWVGEGTRYDLVAPCYDISNLSAPGVNFWYHMKGSGMGTLMLQIPSQGTWVTVWSRSGDQGDQWHEARVPLVDVGAGMATFRFRALRGPSICSDIAIDEVLVADMVPEWETNSDECALDIDGRINHAIGGPIKITACPGSTHVLNAGSTLVGNGWDVVLGAAATVPASISGLTTPGGQVINMDLTDPFLTSLYGLTFLNAYPGSGSLPMGFPTPVTLSAQMILLDAAHADGFQLSAPVEYEVTPGFVPLPAPQPGPMMPGSFTTHDVGCIEFYGVVYTQIQVSTDGFIKFGDGITYVYPSPTGNTAPIFGWWTDLEPMMGGSITVSSPTPTSVRVDYINVPYMSDPMATATFYLDIHANGDLVIGNISGIQPSLMGIGSTWVGVSNGNHSDPGPTSFGVMGPILPANATDAIYDFTNSIGPAIAGGAITLTFTPLTGHPQLHPNYSWTGL